MKGRGKGISLMKMKGEGISLDEGKGVLRYQSDEGKGEVSV